MAVFIMSEGMAIRAVDKYVCSNCWGILYRIPHRPSGHWQVQCGSCQEQTRGFVSKYWVEKRRQDDHFAKIDVTRMLVDIGVMEGSSKTEDQIMTELGF
jgi:hypothetical protein